MAAEKAWWESAIRCFLTDGAERSFERRPQRFRLASFYWLLMINSSLVRMTGRGLEAFVTAETLPAVEQIMGSKGQEDLFAALRATAAGPFRWLGIAMDQCSVGVCASNFLRNQLRLMVEPMSDPSHRVSNDLLLGIKSAGFFPVLLAMKMCYCLNYEPWEGGKWWREARDSLTDALRHFSGEAHPLFAALLPRISMDMGETHKLHDEQWCKETFEGLSSCGVLTCKGPNMAFFGAFFGCIAAGTGIHSGIAGSSRCSFGGSPWGMCRTARRASP